MAVSRENDQKDVLTPYKGQLGDIAIGLCLGCGRRITLCGRPFTSEVECANCHTINVFQESQQPVSCRAAVISG